MLDITLFGQPAFAGVSIATFCIAAGMFALFPYLSIYFQDILGYSPLGAGLRFLPMTAFVFFVPLIVRRFAARVPMRTLIGVGLALVAIGLGLMWGLLSPTSPWTALLPGLVIGGIGIGIANPALAAAALRVVDPARTGMASGISNTFRIGGVALGIAALGALLENRIAASLTATLGSSGHGLANAVSASGTRPLPGPARPRACGHRRVRRRPRRPPPDRRDRARRRCRRRLHAPARAAPGRGSRDRACGLGRRQCVRPRREA